MTEENLNTAENTQAPDILDAPVGLAANVVNPSTVDPVITAAENIAEQAVVEGGVAVACEPKVEGFVQGDDLMELTHSQTMADNLAIVATGNYHLKHLHDTRIQGVSQGVAQIMQATKRATNWTLEEVKQIWDRVESEVKAVL